MQYKTVYSKAILHSELEQKYAVQFPSDMDQGSFNMVEGALNWQLREMPKICFEGCYFYF